MFKHTEHTLSQRRQACSDTKTGRVLTGHAGQGKESDEMSDNRQNIIKATENLLQSRGLARLTTREIAREAKVTEGLIYHHFKDKAELIHEVVEARVSETKNLLRNLPLRVGTLTLLENLGDVLYAVYRAHYDVVLMVCSIFADHQLRTRMQEIMKERDIGPQRSIEGLSLYLAAEQRLGRLCDAVDPQVAAKCLWMISIQSAMNDQLMGRKADASRIRREIHEYLQTLMTGLEPRPPGTPTGSENN
ncbi:MAG: helix-turn-helix domain-containing protein [Smithellaceae bacterium]